MDATAEGIGARKWSYQTRDITHEVMDKPPVVETQYVLSQGALELAVLTKHGEQVKLLLATAPQLWTAANEAVLSAIAGWRKLGYDEGTLYERLSPQEKMLAQVVAKAVGKQDWKDVLQA